MLRNSNASQGLARLEGSNGIPRDLQVSIPRPLVSAVDVSSVQTDILTSCLLDLAVQLQRTILLDGSSTDVNRTSAAQGAALRAERTTTLRSVVRLSAAVLERRGLISIG